MNYRTLTDRATLFKANAHNILAGPIGWTYSQMMRETRRQQGRDPVRGNGWFAEDPEAFAWMTDKMFKPMKCVAATKDATALLVHAAQSIPSDIPVFDMRPEMPSGFLYFERAITDGFSPTRATFWTAAKSAPLDEPVLVVATLDDDHNFGVKNWTIESVVTLDWLYDQMDPGEEEGVAKSRTIWTADESYVVRDKTAALQDAGGHSKAAATEAIRDLRIVLAFNLLLAQGVVEQETWEPTRQIQRQAHRNNKVLDPVQIVRLPKRHYVHGADGEASLVDWSHRWMVTGHWRKQWYAKTEVHRPKWIAPYVKGPDDKPLLVKEKRYVFDPYP